MSSPSQEESKTIREFNELAPKPAPGLETSSPDVAAQLVSDEEVEGVKLHSEMPAVIYDKEMFGQPPHFKHIGEAVPQGPLSSSPAQSGPRQLGIGDALLEVADGKKITRLDWNDPRIYIHMLNETLTLQRANGKDFVFNVCLADIEAEDWIVL